MFVGGHRGHHCALRQGSGGALIFQMLHLRSRDCDAINAEGVSIAKAIIRGSVNDIILEISERRNMTH
jgi:hypothetical protein